MLNQIKLEWSKFSSNTIIMLLTTFFVIFFPCCLYFGKFLDSISESLPIKVDIYDLPNIWDYLGYAGNWIVFFFLGVLIIYTVTIEVQNKTMRQAIIMGMSRQKFFTSKVLNVLVFSLFATVVYTLLSICFGWLNTTNPSLSLLFDNDHAIFRFFLMCVGYLSFALFLAFAFRKSGLAVFFYLSYMIIIEPLMKILTQQYLFSNKYVNYYPMNAVEDLMPNPLFKFADKVPKNIDYEFLLTKPEAVGLSIFYTLVFLGISYYFFLRRDI